MRRLLKVVILFVIVALPLAFVLGENIDKKVITIENYTVAWHDPEYPMHKLEIPSSNISVYESNASYANVGFQVSKAKPGKVVIGEPVSWTQKFSVTNNENVSNAFVVDLSQITDHKTDKVIIQGIQQKLFVEQLAGGETKNYTLSYQTAALEMEVNCTNVTVGDYLPDDAVVIESEISLDAVVDHKCDVMIYNSEGINYQNVSIVIDINDVDSIYYADENRFLEVADTVVI